MSAEKSPTAVLVEQIRDTAHHLRNELTLLRQEIIAAVAATQPKTTRPLGPVIAAAEAHLEAISGNNASRGEALRLYRSLREDFIWGVRLSVYDTHAFSARVTPGDVRRYLEDTYPKETPNVKAIELITSAMEKAGFWEE